MATGLQQMPTNPMEHDRYAPDTFRVVGRRGVRRIDGERKASGKAIYTKDVQLPGMLYMRIMTSPYPNAKIRSMDTSKAEALAGVRCVLRYDDPEIFGKRAASTHGVEEEILSQCAYFEGQQLGVAIAADSEDIANHALGLVRVEWEQRPFVLDPEIAALPDAPSARPEWLGPSNHLALFFGAGAIFKFGDVEKGFEEADQVITFEACRKYHGLADAEPLAGVAKWEGDCLELWVHHQHPYEHKWVAHQWFGIPMNKVKINSPYNGAMFGGWNWIDYSMVPTCISAIMAKRTGRPVKWIFNRRDDFTFGSMDAMATRFKVGFKKDGAITAVKIRTIFENMAIQAAGHLLENTRTPNLESETALVQVNKGPTHALRCEQMPPSFCLTHVFNHVAAALNMDPTEVALKNDGVEGHDITYLEEFKKANGFPARDSLRECIEAGKRQFRWEEHRHAPGARRLPNGRMHGVSFTWTHEWDDTRGAAAAALMIQADGSASIIGLRSDVGVNAETAYCQIVAEELGMKVEDIFFRQGDDTHLPLMTPDGSCNLTTNGYLMQKLGRMAKQKLLELATTGFNVIEYDVPPAFPGLRPDELDVKESIVFVKADPSNRKTVEEVVKDLNGSIMRNMHDYAAIQHTSHPPVYVWTWHRQGRFGIEEGRHRLCRQAHFCEVEVDAETGEIEVKRVLNVNDVGKAMSPEGVEGQQYGGTYMGIGRNRSEEYIWDEKTGVLLNGNLCDYKFATMNDIGRIDTCIVETGMGYGPYGSVGVGEVVATVTSYLLDAAVYNAVGVWVDDGPLTPDKVLKALGKA
ncbi:MAG: molybdopterin cofactor-binding domain-containing protein [Syntrophorhabdales bacterium]|jgi:xanthine dehydrogenase molybdenum-binding subunit